MPYVDPEKQREYMRKQYLAKRDRILEKAKTPEFKAHRRAIRYKNHEAYRTSEKARRKLYIGFEYGIDKDEFLDLLEAQGNLCRICKSEFPSGNRRTAYIDHCHKTGRVRGILCPQCNSGLGMFKDNKEFLASAIEYLDNTTPVVL